MNLKKIISILVALFLVANIANAERYVNYNAFEGKIDQNLDFKVTTNQLKNFNADGYICLDKECSQLGEKIFSENSGDSSIIQLTYPTNLMSDYGYAVYYTKEGFIPWESNPNWFGTEASDPQGPYNIYLGKKSLCSSKIEEFTITNSERVNTPIVIFVKADADLATKSAINNAGPLKAVPEDLKEHYTVKTLVSLNILDKSGNIIFFEQKELDIGFGENKGIEFSFIPTKEGEFKAVATTKVSDEKCSSYQAESEEKEFFVLGYNPTGNICYVELGNLEVNNNVKAGSILALGLDKISNYQKNDNDVEPISMEIDVELSDQSGNEIVDEKVILGKNTNTIYPERYDLVFNIPIATKSGDYTLSVTGTTSDERCNGNIIMDKIIKNVAVKGKVVIDFIKRFARHHDFSLNGFHLETSNTKDGITGFLLLKNTGDFNENGVSVTAIVYDLGIYEVLTNNINLRKGDSFWIPIDINVPFDTKEGEYIISIKVGNDRHKEEKNLIISVDEIRERVKVLTKK